MREVIEGSNQMPRTEITERTLYKFDELEEKAKEKAREWFRGLIEAKEYSESVYEDAATIAALMGLNIRTRPVKLIGGDTRYKPCIWWSGFSSQGDGACFEGRWEYKADALEAVRGHAPLDERLHGIAADFADPKVKGCYAESKHRGRYYHEYSMEIDANTFFNGDEGEEEVPFTNEQCEHIKEMFADFARWIYRMLEAEHDYCHADEQVDENIRCNDYEFTEDGRLA
jgi:hypothetical protein